MPGARGKHSIAATIAVVLLMALLAYQLVVAVRAGLAELYAMPATRLMDQWQDAVDELEYTEEVFLPDETAWQGVLHNLERAAQLAPANPAYQAELGRLFQFKLQDEALEVETIEALNTTVLGHYQKAAYLRPTWPYYWWDIALAEYDSYHTHTETYQEALQNAARFGPWVTDVQHFVAEMSLETWESLDAATRLVALDNFERALQRQEDDVIDLFDDYDAWDSLCSNAGAGDPGLSSSYPNITTGCSDLNTEE